MYPPFCHRQKTREYCENGKGYEKSSPESDKNPGENGGFGAGVV